MKEMDKTSLVMTKKARTHIPNCKKNYKKGPRRKVFQLLMMCGCLPYQGLIMLDGNYYTITRKIDEMKKEGILEKRKVKSEWLIGFAEYSNEIKKIADEYYRDELKTHYENTALEYWNRARYKETDLNRIVRLTETIMFMDGLDIDYMIGEKEYLDDTKIKYSNVFFAPSELNNAAGDSSKIRGSRETGLMVTDGGNYAVYNMSKWFPRIKSGYEFRFRQFVNKLLVMKDMDKLDGAILMYESETILHKYLLPDEQSQKETVRNLEDAYENVYCVPYNKQGQALVDMMMQNYWKETIIQIIYEHLRSNMNYVFLEDKRQGTYNDGYDLVNDVELLIMLIPNIKKLHNFIQRARAIGDSKKYLIVCYEYEKNIFEKAVNGSCMIKSLTFDSVYSVFNYRRNR